MMDYTQLLKHHIDLSGMSLREIVDKMEAKGVKRDRSYISMLKSRRAKRVASDEVNRALAEVLGINPLALRIAAVKEKISPDLHPLIKKID